MLPGNLNTKITLQTSLKYVKIAMQSSCVQHCMSIFLFFVQQYTEIIETQKFNKADASSILDHEYVSQKFTFLVLYEYI